MEAIGLKSEILPKLSRMVKVEAIGLKSEILPKLSRMVKVEAIGLKSEILLELSRMELRLSGNIGKAGAKDEAKRSG